MACKLPLVSLSLATPAAGLPPISDWQTVFHSIIFSGLDLEREPLDVAAALCMAGQPLCPQSLHIVKGFTRISAVALICITIMESVDLEEDNIMDLLLPLFPVLDHAWEIPLTVPCSKFYFSIP